MLIVVKKLDGKKEKLDVDPSATTSDVATTLSERLGIAKSQIRLIYQVTMKAFLNPSVEIRGSQWWRPKHLKVPTFGPTLWSM